MQCIFQIEIFGDLELHIDYWLPHVPQGLRVPRQET